MIETKFILFFLWLGNGVGAGAGLRTVLITIIAMKKEDMRRNQ